MEPMFYKGDTINDRALHIAVARNNFKLAKWLLDNDADPLAVSKDGSSPVQIAISYGSLGCFKLLVPNYVL